MLGLVIIGALIIIAVKQSETNTHSQKLGPDLERQRNMKTGAEEDSSTETTMQETTTESYQDKIRKLYNLVSECNRLGSSSSKCSAAVLGEANESSIDDLIEELKTEISEVKFNETIGSFESFSGFLANLTQVNSGGVPSQTNYASVISILQPYLVETPGARLTLGDDDRREGSDDRGRSSSSSTVYTPAEEVQCDHHREKRCRDKRKCYPVSAHCDFKVKQS